MKISSSSFYSKFLIYILIFIQAGCSTVYRTGLGEKGKGKYLMPAAILMLASQDITQKKGEQDDEAQKLNLMSSLFLDAFSQVNEETFKIADEVLLVKGSRIDEVVKLLGEPNKIETENNEQLSYFYYDGHLELIFKTQRLCDVISHDSIGEDFLPVDIRIEKRPWWVGNRVIK